MSPRRRAAFGLWAALTFSSAVLVHGVVHAVGDRGFAWDSPDHLTMLLGALVLLGAAARPLGLVGRRSERRRRIALVRAGLGRVSGRMLLAGALAQGAVGALLFLGEGASFEPDRVFAAILSGLLAVLFSAFVFRATRDRVVALLVALAAAIAPALPRAALARRPRIARRALFLYALFVPNRPPPAFAL